MININEKALNDVVKHFEDSTGRKAISEEKGSLIYAFCMGEAYMAKKYNEAEKAKRERRYRNYQKNSYKE